MDTREGLCRLSRQGSLEPVRWSEELSLEGQCSRETSISGSYILRHSTVPDREARERLERVVLEGTNKAMERDLAARPSEGQVPEVCSTREPYLRTGEPIGQRVDMGRLIQNFIYSISGSFFYVVF